MFNFISFILFSYLALKLFKARKVNKDNLILFFLVMYVSVIDLVNIKTDLLGGGFWFFAASVLIKLVIAFCCILSLSAKRSASKNRAGSVCALNKNNYNGKVTKAS